MSILLNSIDCPCLTNDCLHILNEHYSIQTTNDFALWLIKSSDDRTKYLSSTIIQCIQSCMIAHTANIQYRQISNSNSYKLDYSLFDNETILNAQRHLIFIYEYFNQNQWNQFFNMFLLRLFLGNESIKINYINTNISLFDLNSFYHDYCCLSDKIFLHRNDLFEKYFFFNQCFHLEAFENQLDFIENNQDSFQILIIDDFFSLIKPYLGLDRRIKGKILQLTYRLNRLAQKQSILIINGIILNTKKRTRNFPITDDTRFDSFHADQLILLQSLTNIENEIYLKNLNKKSQDKHLIISKFDLDDWMKISNGEF